MLTSATTACQQVSVFFSHYTAVAATVVAAAVSHSVSAGLVVVVKAVPIVTLASMVVTAVAAVKASCSKSYYSYHTLY